MVDTFCFSCTISLTIFGCLKIIGGTTLLSQRNKSCLSFQVIVWVICWNIGRANGMVQEKMELDCLIKTNNKASCLLTSVWPREYSWSLAQLHCWESSAVLHKVLENNLIISLWSVFQCPSYYFYMLFFCFFFFFIHFDHINLLLLQSTLFKSHVFMVEYDSYKHSFF